MEVVDMLLDIGRSREAMLGPEHIAVSDAHFVSGLALIQVRRRRLVALHHQCCRFMYIELQISNSLTV